MSYNRFLETYFLHVNSILKYIPTSLICELENALFLGKLRLYFTFQFALSQPEIFNSIRRCD